MSAIRGTVNRVELLGWLGADPELRFTSNGTAVCNLRIATKRWAGRNEAGERLVETDWTKVEAWDRLAERCNNFLHKGSRVLIIGSLRTDSWQDQETGQTRFKTYVRAEDVTFLEARGDGQESAEANDTAEEDIEDIPF